MAMRPGAAAARHASTLLLPLAFVGAAAPMAALGAAPTACAPTEFAQAGTSWTSAAGEAMQVRPSALFSAPERRIYESRAGRGSGARTTLSDGDPAQGGQVFAVLGGAEGTRNALAFRLPGGGDLEATKLRLNRIEHLYAFVFRQPPQTRFEAPAEGAAPRRAGQVLSQPDMLRKLATWRECAAGQVRERDPSAHLKRWTVPVIEAVRPNPADGLRVAARIEVRPPQTVGTTLSFARGAHLACSGGVDQQGVGTCTLFDSHGHEDHDHGGASEPLLITFGGSVEAERIVLPMTAIVPASRAGHTTRPAHEDHAKP